MESCVKGGQNYLDFSSVISSASLQSQFLPHKAVDIISGLHCVTYWPLVSKRSRKLSLSFERDARKKELLKLSVLHKVG